MHQIVWKSNIPNLQRVKGALEGRDITVQEIADYVGVTRATIYTWINDDGVPTIDASKTAKLSAYFGVPAWRLWDIAERDNVKVECAK